MVNLANCFQIRKMSPILQMKVQNFMKHNIKSLLNFVVNEIVEYETENFNIILHCGTFSFVLLEKVSSQPYDRVLPLPPPRPSRTPLPQSFSHAETHRQATQHGCLTRLLAGRWWLISEKESGEENNISYWADSSSQGRTKIFCTRTMSPTNQQGRTPFICTPRVPICFSFNSRQGSPLSGLSAPTHLSNTLDK
jgi:hypothetical protein